MVILSHALWQRRFGADPKILNRMVCVRGRSLQIVGVMPAKFDFPRGAQLWIPLAPSEDLKEVGDMRRGELEHREPPSCFLPHSQFAQPNMTLVVRTSGDPWGLAKVIPQEVWAIDKNQPVTRIATVEELLSERLSLRRFNAAVLAVFSLLALLLAALGIYSVISFTVSQSLHDIGIRVALGAQSRDVLKGVLGKGLSLILLSVAVGLGGAVGASRVLSHMLYGVTATDPATFLGLSLVLSILAFAAMYLPARRAANADPLTLLRAGH